jgi:transketolase
MFHLDKMRKTFIKTLESLAENDDSICLITPDIGFGVLEDFARKFPDRFFNTGIREAHSVSMAVGMALKGKKPFVYTINSFLVFGAFEQIRMLSYMQAPVVLVGAGVSDEYTNQGISHYGYGDKTVLSTLPINIRTPLTKEEVPGIVLEAYHNPRTYYLRLSRYDQLKPDVLARGEN